MEKEITEFVREFNAGLENSNEYNSLQYKSDGYNEGIYIPEIFIWTDESGSLHYKRKALSSAIRQLSLLNEVAHNMFGDETLAWENEIKKVLTEKFPYAKMKVKREATLRFKVIISGEYNEDTMSDFVDVIKQDFEWMFEGCKLDYEY